MTFGRGNLKTRKEQRQLSRSSPRHCTEASDRPIFLLPFPPDFPPPAGSDTSTATINNFFLAMILYPEVQEKIRKEIDSVIGTDRLPEFEDEDSLPYLTAALKELMRCESICLDYY